MTTVRRMVPLSEPKTGKSPKTQVEKLTASAWHFAHSTLWADKIFTQAEITAHKKLIAEYFSLAKEPKEAFKAFCERVILAKYYAGKHSQYHIPSPVLWLNRHYSKGFAGTLRWYIKIKEKRNLIPQYAPGLRALSEGFLNYSQKPSDKTFERCRRKLLKLHAHNLLQCFYSAVIHFNYSLN